MFSLNQSKLEWHEDVSLDARQVVRVVVDELEELAGEKLLRALPVFLGPVGECRRLRRGERSSTFVETCEIAMRQTIQPRPSGHSVLMMPEVMCVHT